MAQSAEDVAREAELLTARTSAWAFELVAMPSVTGTEDEADFALRLNDRLRRLPAFSGQPERVWTIPVHGDPLGRACVAALVRGTGPRTVVLTGHFDTVHLEDYGPLAPLATQPHALREALLERLGRAATPSETRARADLANGCFLPGRGLLDMKSGLAAGLAVLEAFAEQPQRPGNLLFLAVPDEEANSAGARSAAAALPEIARRLGISLEAGINLDALVDEGDGEVGRAIALGTIGKLLPSALVIGTPVHASDALKGLNAGMLAAALAAAVEWAAELTDRTGPELGAPPTLLGLKDNRAGYDVTTPDRVWAYWNVMSHRRAPAEVLANFTALCRQAAAGAVQALAERADALGVQAPLPAVEILTFEELKTAVVAQDAAAAERFAMLARDLAAGGLDVPEQCRRLTEHLWEAGGRSGPAVVTGFASWPYLPTQLRGEAGERLEAAARLAAATLAERHGTSVSVIRYFPGISDVSHLGQTDPASIPVLAANTPAWGFAIGWPREAFAGVPMINAGPWGRDYHTRLERLHLPYAFEVLPELLLGIVRRFLTP